MISLLGLPLDTALNILEKENVPCTVQSVQSNKGTGGSDIRVVRVCKGEGNSITLLCSAFCTTIEKEHDASE